MRKKEAAGVYEKKQSIISIIAVLLVGARKIWSKSVKRAYSWVFQLIIGVEILPFRHFGSFDDAQDECAQCRLRLGQKAAYSVNKAVAVMAKQPPNKFWEEGTPSIKLGLNIKKEGNCRRWESNPHPVARTGF